MPLGLSQRVSFRVCFGRGPLSPNTAGAAAKSEQTSLSWINSLYASIQKRLFFRGEDKVLIVPPNQVYRLNDGAIKMLTHLEAGNPIETFPGLRGKERTEETENFFLGIRELFTENGRGRYAGGNPSFEPVSFDFTYTKLPILAEIAVTYRCNNRCAFCYVPGPEERKRRQLSTKKIRRIIDVFHTEARVPFFSFTGGEPLLRGDIEQCTEYAVSKGLTVNLVSNGTLCTKARAGSLKKAGLSSAQISIEAATPKLHDTLVGRSGAFTESLTGIENLRAAGIPVQTNTTLNAKNKEAVLDLPQFLHSRGINRFAVNLFIPAGTGRQHGELFLSYSEAAPLIEDLHDEARRLGMTFFWYSPTPYCVFNPLTKGLGNKSCAAADGLLSVSPEGDVLPCSSFHEPLGNLLTEGFDSIWFSKRAAYFQNKHFAPRGCSECGSFHACQGACPLYWDFAGTEELAQAVKTAQKRGDDVTTTG